MGDLKASKIANFLNTKLIGKNISIFTVSSLLNPKTNTLVFAKKDFKIKKKIKLLGICTKKNYEISSKKSGLSYICCKNPRLAFAKVVTKFFTKQVKPFVHESAIIADGALIHPSVSIGANCVIEAGVKINKGTIIMNNVTISRNVKIGKYCYIKSGTIIGEDGFGFDFDKDKVPVRLPHMGSVIIGDNVEIGSLNTIQKGTIDDTIIRSQSKLSDHVHIAHNTFIDKNCIIAAHAQICGSVKIGKNCWIGANSSIIQNIKVKNNVTIGIGSVVINNINDNKKIMGFEGLDLSALKEIKKKLKFGKF